MSVENCPIREHTGDGAYVGRCDFAVHDGVCPRHGHLFDYPTLDDREVDPRDRRFAEKDRSVWHPRRWLRSGGEADNA